MASVVAKKEREVIIVAYDGSDRSRKCLRYALTLMDKSKDTLEVVLPMHKEVEKVVRNFIFIFLLLFSSEIKKRSTHALNFILKGAQLFALRWSGCSQE